MNSACNCCGPAFEAAVLLECRSVGATCDFPSTFCYPAYTFDPLPDWEDGNCFNVVTFFGTSHAGAVIASNFAGEDGAITPGAPFANRHGEWRISHEPSMTCFLRVWFRVWANTIAAPSWTPPIADAERYVDDVYEWDGTGNPCIADPSVSVYDIANRIIPTAEVIAVPGPRTVISVEILKFSYLEDYEPDISDPLNPQPSGFPDPTWEPLPP